MLKKFVCSLFAVGAMFCFASAVYAGSNVSVKVNDTKVLFEQEPVIENGRTLIPLRGVFNALNCETEWQPATKTVVVKKGNDVVSLNIGDYNVYKNGKISAKIDVPAKVINGRTMVPIRGVFELFDNYVGWNESERTVEIYSPDGNNVDVDLKEISEKNKAGSILQNCNTVEKSAVYSNGNSLKTTYTKDQNDKLTISVSGSTINSYYTEADRIYYENFNANSYIIADILGNSKEYLDGYDSVGWSYTDDEKVVFAVENNGKYYIKTEISDISKISGFADDMELSENKGKYICRFIVDSKTKEIMVLEDYQEIDGVSTLISSVSITKDVESYIPQFVQRIVSVPNKNYITFVIPNGDTEEKYTVATTPNNYVSFFGMDEYNIFSDKECKTPYDVKSGGIKVSGNVTLYCLKK